MRYRLELGSSRSESMRQLYFCFCLVEPWYRMMVSLTPDFSLLDVLVGLLNTRMSPKLHMRISVYSDGLRTDRRGG